MTTPSQDLASASDDLERVAWLLEQLLVDSGRVSDRSKVRRALDEAADALISEPTESHWWKWVYESSRSLGLRCKIVDCTFSQLTGMVRDGGQAITRTGELKRWIAIESSNGRHIEVLCPLTTPSRSRQTLAKLRDTLSANTPDTLFRCVVLEPPLAGAAQSEVPLSDRTPLHRVLSLMHAERGDIWVIMVYSAITGLLGLATPLAVETLVSTVAFGRVLQPVLIIALMLFAFLSFSAAIVGLQTYVVEIIQRRFFARVVGDLAYRLPRVEQEAIDGQDSRELVNRFFDVFTIQKIITSMLLEGISLILFAVIGMAVLAFYHPWLLGYNVVLLMLLAFVVFVLGRGAVKTSLKESKIKYKTAAWLEQLAVCPIAFRSWGANEFALDRADHLTYEYLQARRTHFGILIRQIGFSLGIQAVASTVLLGIGGWLVISGQLTLGQLVAAELIVTVIVGAFAKLGKYMELYYDLMASVEKLGMLFDLPMERQDGLLMIPSDTPAEIVINEVDHPGWPGQPGLKNLSFTVRSGDRLMLYGNDGSGSSQLIDMLFAIRKPHAGHITINNIDPRDLRPDALRRTTAMVRDIEIFPGTVSENVHLERPGISTSDVRDALEATGLIEEISRLPDGLETELTNNGYPLMPDQCRKLMIARAIVGHPTLLLIDNLVDGLSDHDMRRIVDLLIAPNQPWTLVMATGRIDIAEAGTHVHDLSRQPLSIDTTATRLGKLASTDGKGE